MLLISSNSYSGKKMETLENIIKNDQWAVAEGTHKKLSLIIRFRNKLTTQLNLSQHPQLIQIYWGFGEHPSGMPSDKDSKEMEIFENRLVEALESDLTGILTSVITTNGYREWVYYTTSIEEFGDKLHNMPQEKEPYPIEIEADNDPNWDYFFNSVHPENET